MMAALEGTGLTLAPESTTTEHLSGRIVPQSGSDLDTIGVLFSNFLAGENQTLNVFGDTVEPDGSTSVSWLSTAFKTLELNVTLPGQKFTIIESITIDDLEIVMTEDSEAFAPLASSKDTLATYKNPFGFSLAVVQSGENITLASGGTGVATVRRTGSLFYSMLMTSMKSAQLADDCRKRWCLHGEYRRFTSIVL